MMVVVAVVENVVAVVVVVMVIVVSVLCGKDMKLIYIKDDMLPCKWHLKSINKSPLPSIPPPFVSRWTVVDNGHLITVFFKEQAQCLTTSSCKEINIHAPQLINYTTYQLTPPLLSFPSVTAVLALIIVYVVFPLIFFFLSTPP